MTPDEMRAQRKTLADIMLDIDQAERKVDTLGDSEETRNILRCLLQAKVHLLKKRRILDEQWFAL